jgi:hypothetical protein
VHPTPPRRARSTADISWFPWPRTLANLWVFVEVLIVIEPLFRAEWRRLIWADPNNLMLSRRCILDLLDVILSCFCVEGIDVLFHLHIYIVDLAHQVRPSMMSLAFSATIAVGALVFEPIKLGKILLSQIRRPEKPFTFMVGSTTALSSDPMRQVPTG